MVWHHLFATGHFGFPQPESGFALATYDSTYCDRCGIGGVQRIPFRFRSEPRARHSQFLQLNWVFDEFFVRPEVETGFKKAGVSGVAFGPALHNRTGQVLETVQQLMVLSVLPAALDVVGLQPVTCKPDNEEGPSWYGDGQPRYAPDYPYCRRIKYHWPQTQALRFRPQAFAAAPDIVKSFEWFGSGGSAYRAILVSERVVETVEKYRWRGVKWAVVEFAD
jgi:hypothetical protein